ncbi:cation:proton antiporter [Lacticaseibacillus baoqingensis]|uniref:Cation:proton antiporter n=1 Tax=Lacticaseibacillus baoqingensis TaxID=2486013 RepID=A0ABW4E3R6_9LACO|nr:sodium:proton antiporter [Lacticaseibacillus baoqingensis]
MHLLEAILLLITLVILSNIISHYVVVIPVSLIQAGLGLLVALVFQVKLQMQTDWFMLLFTAPLLFNDGRHFPKRELWALRGPIIGNAIFLVFATTFIGGYFIHWLIPSLPLAAALALAAILSPTDPIAVQSIAQRVHLPKGILHLVSGESLINDASGLIGFKYGIAATVTGSFVATQAIGDFFFVAIIGALAGAVLMAALNLLRLWLLQQGLNDVILHTVMQLVTPLLIYLVVDEGLHASGVIAVVVAGLLNNARGNRYIAALPELRIVSERTWDIVVYVLNGIIFLILGIELPVAMHQTITARDVNTGQALLDVVLVYLVVLSLRVAWVYGYQVFGHLPQASFKTAVLSGLSGVRGAITLVGVLAVPLTLANGQPFPERHLMLFIAAGFVVLSLIVAVVGLPLFTKTRTPLTLRGSTVSADDDDDEGKTPAAPRLLTQAQAQRFLYQMAVRRLESERREANQKPVLDLISEYQILIRRLDLAADTSEDPIPPLVRDELTLRRIGLAGELAALEAVKATLSAPVYAKMAKRLRQKQADIDTMLAHAGKPTVRMHLAKWRLAVTHGGMHLLGIRRSKAGYQQRLALEKTLAKGGLKQLSAYLKQPEQRHHRYNRQVIYALIVQYRNRIASVKAIAQHKSTQYEAQLQQLRAIALAAERAAIHDLLEQGYITGGLAQQLSQGVNYTENAAAMTAEEV